MVQAARDGEEWALAELFRVYQPQLLRYLRRQAPGAFDDLAAEVWVGVTRGLHRFTGDEPAFRGWLFTIARCRLVEHWRSLARSRSEPMSHTLENHVPAVDHHDPAHLVLDELASQEAVDKATAGLTADQAAIVRLRVVEGLDVGEVARILRRSPGSVRVTCLRALRRLATRFPRGAAIVVAGCLAATAAGGVAATRTVVHWLSDPPRAEAPPSAPLPGDGSPASDPYGTGGSTGDDDPSGPATGSPDPLTTDTTLSPAAGERQRDRDAEAGGSAPTGSDGDATTLPADDSTSTTTTTTTTTTADDPSGTTPGGAQPPADPPVDPPGLGGSGPPRADQAEGRGQPRAGSPPGRPT